MTHYHQVSDGGRRRRADRRRALDPGQALGRPAGGDDRGAHAGGRPGAGELHDPGHVGAHGVALPRQAVDEGGAAGGRGADRRVDGRRRPPHEVHAFADAVGYPADPQAAHRRRRPGHHPGRRPRPSSTQALGRFGGQGVESIAVEEFVEGHEGFYDTVSVDGHAALDFVSHYYPNVLEAMRTRWISPQFISTNRVDSVAGLPGAARAGRPGQRGARHRHQRHAHGVVLRAEGAAVLRDRLPAAGRRRLGPLLGGQRPRPLPRVGERRRARPRRRPARRGGYATGIVALRPDRDGQITGYSGVDEIQARSGEWVIDAHLPAPGTPTQPVEAGYMGQRLRPDAPPRLRRAARHARRRGPHRPRARPVSRP